MVIEKSWQIEYQTNKQEMKCFFLFELEKAQFLRQVDYVFWSGCHGNALHIRQTYIIFKFKHIWSVSDFKIWTSFRLV